MVLIKAIIEFKNHQTLSLMIIYNACFMPKTSCDHICNITNHVIASNYKYFLSTVAKRK
jgi:hypothetical protein